MKRIAVSEKWLKFLTWPGLASATAGFVAGNLSGWQLLPTILLVAGVALLLLGLSFSGKSAGAFWQQRSTQAGTNAAIATLAVLVILGLVNFVAVQNAARFDLTETQLFTLAPASKTVVQALEAPVQVVVFDAVQNPQDVHLLESYRQASNNFTFEYVDPVANPTRSQAFGATQAGMVFVVVGEERRFLQTIGSTANAANPGAAATLSERQLTNALDQIVSDRTLAVYFVQGHDEPLIEGPEAQLGQAVAALTGQDYQVQTLNLAAARTVPADADVVVVAGPAQDFFAAEVAALEAYLSAGGGLLLMLDPRSDGGLNALLDDWGVVLDDRLVLDTSGAGQFVGLGPAAPIVSNYGDHPITQDFGDGRSFFPLARPIESRELPDTTTTPLLLTDPQSRAEAISDTGDLNFDPNAPADGPYVLGVALSRPADPTATTPASVAAEADEGAEAENAEETAPDANAVEPDAEANETDTAVDDAAAGEAVEPEATATSDPEADSAVVDEGVTDEAGDAESEPEASSLATEGEAAEDPDSATPSADVPDDTASPDAPDGADPLAEEDATDPTATESPADESRLVVIGNTSFAIDGSFDQQLNGDVFLNAVNWLGQESDATLSIRPKTVTDRRLSMTGQQAWGLSIFSLLVLPATGLALAILMAWRRR
ncbi:MAG: Gldg family protein [Cyanobacteria bacterium P01_D01_bin.115]